MPETENPATKRRRITKACDFCHRRGRRCCPAQHNPDKCSTCIGHGVACTWNRVPARRGVKPRNGTPTGTRQQWVLNDDRHGSQALLQTLIDIFFNDVYPMYVRSFPVNFKLTNTDILEYAQFMKRLLGHNGKPAKFPMGELHIAKFLPCVP